MTTSNTPAPKAVEALPELPTVLDIMDEVWAYANVSYGIHEAEGDARVAKQAAMGHQSHKVRSMVAALAAAQAEQAKRTPEQLMAEVEAMKVAMTAQMRRDSGRETLEAPALSPQPPSPDVERQAVFGYLSPATNGRRYFYAPQDCSESMKRNYTPVFAHPPQEAGDAEQKSVACSVPPSGWTCARTAGHAGPCAASHVTADPLADLSEAIAAIPCDCGWKRRENDDHLSGCPLFDVSMALAALRGLPQEAGDADAELLNWIEAECTSMEYEGRGVWTICGEKRIGGGTAAGSLRPALRADIAARSPQQEPKA